MRLKNGRFSILLAQFVTVFIVDLPISAAQKTKVGGGFSKFRENISIVKQRLQQPVATVSQEQQEVSVQNVIAPQVDSYRRVVETSSVSSQLQQQQVQADAEPTVYGSVKGVPGQDFPGYTSIPDTRFSCDGLPFDPGMYADESTGCQVYHLCYGGRRESFLCGVGTVFNQAIMGCDFWHSVECAKSSRYYQLNAEFGKSSAEPTNQLQTQRVSSSSLVKSQRQQVVGGQTVRAHQSSELAEFRPGAASSFKESSYSSSLAAPLPAQKSSFVSTEVQSSGKTSAGRAPGGPLSPSRRIALNSGYESAGAGGQFASESSTMFDVARKGAPKLAGEQAAAGGARENAIQSGAGEEAWKPYFRSKRPPAVGPTRPPEATVPSAAPAAADQEPSFGAAESSGEVPQVPSSSSSPAAAASVEADVSSALTSTAAGPVAGEPSPTTTAATTTTTSAPETSTTAPTSATITTPAPAEPTTGAPAGETPPTSATSDRKESEVEYVTEAPPRRRQAAGSGRANISI